MVGPYRELFRSPGGKALTTAGLLARMPLSMVGIGLITMVSQTRGSLGLAGGLGATYAVATAVSTASPTEEPIRCMVLTSPAATPASLRGTPRVAALMIETKPIFLIVSTSRSSRCSYSPSEYRSVPSASRGSHSSRRRTSINVPMLRCTTLETPGSSTPDGCGG